MKGIFVETRIFEKFRQEYLSEKQYFQLQVFLMETPKAGDVIPGTGGLRKLRWVSKGKGKRSGVRIIYYYLTDKSRFYLLTLYAKNEVTDLKPEEKQILKKLVKDWKNEQT